MSTIHLRLRHLRQKQNLSQEDLAKRLGISRQAVIALEQGASLPSLPVVMAILRELDITFQELLENTWPSLRFPQAIRTPDERILSLPTHLIKSIPIQLIETETHFYIEAEMAGVKEEEVSIDLGQQHLVIMGTRKTRIPLATGQARSSEIEYGPLVRIICLPAPADTERVEAEFRNGLLLVTIPKLVSQLKRRITFRKEEHGSR